MKNASSLIKRAAISLCLFSAVAGTQAEAQYYGSSPADVYRHSIGLPPQAVSMEKDRHSADRFQAMKQTSAVRIGCGVSDDFVIENLSSGFTAFVGLAWGGVLALLALGGLAVRRGTAEQSSLQGALSKRRLVRGAALLAAGLSAQWVFGIANAIFSPIGLSALAYVAPLLVLLGAVAATAQNRARAFKCLAMGSGAVVAIPLALWAVTSAWGWYWTEATRTHSQPATTTTTIVRPVTAPTSIPIFH